MGKKQNKKNADQVYGVKMVVLVASADMPKENLYKKLELSALYIQWGADQTTIELWVEDTAEAEYIWKDLFNRGFSYRMEKNQHLIGVVPNFEKQWEWMEMSQGDDDEVDDCDDCNCNDDEWYDDDKPRKKKYSKSRACVYDTIQDIRLA